MGNENQLAGPETGRNEKARVKFEVFGKMMIEKKVKLSGNSGRVYVPLEWVHHHVKVIRID